METPAAAVTTEQIYALLAQVCDPEVPVLTILDLGIVRTVQVSGSEVTVTITPTYSGCPAMDIISMQIRMVLSGRGFSAVHIRQQLSPAWTTDWMTDTGKQKLREYGIAPPQYAAKAKDLFEEDEVPCPHCGAGDTRLVSAFGATSCKAAWQCNTCGEPFEHFKCH